MEDIWGKNFITASDYISVTGISRATFYRIRQHPKFPKTINVAVNSPRYWGPDCVNFILRDSNSA
jgi:hypothetical protein